MPSEQGRKAESAGVGADVHPGIPVPVPRALHCGLAGLEVLRELSRGAEAGAEVSPLVHRPREERGWLCPGVTHWAGARFHHVRRDTDEHVRCPGNQSPPEKLPCSLTPSSPPPPPPAPPPHTLQALFHPLNALCSVLRYLKSPIAIAQALSRRFLFALSFHSPVALFGQVDYKILR